MVAQRGITKPAISSLTPMALVRSNVTGMVAADDCVPSAVKYAGNIIFKALNGLTPENIQAIVY